MRSIDFSQPSGLTDPGGRRTSPLGWSGFRLATYWVLAGSTGGRSPTVTSAAMANDGKRVTKRVASRTGDIGDIAPGVGRGLLYPRGRAFGSARWPPSRPRPLSGGVGRPGPHPLGSAGAVGPP